MSSIRNIVLGCVSEHGNDTSNSKIMPMPKRLPKVKFGAPLASALIDGELPEPFIDVVVYIAREGVATSDLFRRPGSHPDLKQIVRRLAEGSPIQLSDYNFYTLASVVKMFLLKLPGGMFGADVEQRMLNILHMTSHTSEQCDAIHRVIVSLPLATQRLVSLLFGTWFRVVNHCEYNAMTSEALAKSVAGSVFHTCATEPTSIDAAVRLIRLIIDNFGQPSLLGPVNIQYFTERTSTAIRVREKFKYQLDGTCPLLMVTDSEVQRAANCGNECQELFTRIISTDATCRGFDPSSNVISKKEFYGSTDHYASLATNVSHVSSLSAPDVNQSCSSPGNESCVASTLYEAGSLKRFDSVRRRQIVRLRKRTDWFLSPVVPRCCDSAHTQLDCDEPSPARPSSEVDCRLSPARIPQFSISDLDTVDSEASVLLHPRFDEGYCSRSAVVDNSSLSLSTTTSRQPAPPCSASSLGTSQDQTGRPVSAPLMSSSDSRYFRVDRFYGAQECRVLGTDNRTTNGDSC